MLSARVPRAPEAPVSVVRKETDGRTGMREAKAGEVLFSEAVAHASENVGDSDAHGILIELKDDAARSLSTDALSTAVTFIRGKEGGEADLKRELLALSAPMRAEPGNLAYDLHQSPHTKNLFMRFEVWRNAEALETHKQTPHIKRSFRKRQEQGWMTEITTWDRVADR